MIYVLYVIATAADTGDVYTVCDRWGNFFVDKIVKNENRVERMEGRYNAGATNFSKTKKATWLAAVVFIHSITYFLLILSLIPFYENNIFISYSRCYYYQHHIYLLYWF